jgi:hypothetical protein
MPTNRLQGLLLPIDHHWFNSLQDIQSGRLGLPTSTYDVQAPRFARSVRVLWHRLHGWSARRMTRFLIGLVRVATRAIGPFIHLLRY